MSDCPISDEDPPPPTAEDGMLVLGYLGASLTDDEVQAFREAWPGAHQWDGTNVVTAATAIYIDHLPAACGCQLPIIETHLRSHSVISEMKSRRGRELYRKIEQARAEGRPLSELLPPKRRYQR